MAMSDLASDTGRAFSSKIRKEIPLGALSLATYVEEYTEAEAVILDLNLKFYDLVNEGKINGEDEAVAYIKEIISQKEGGQFDFCGISAIFTPVFGYLGVISRIVKELFPDIFIMAGGAVPSNLMGEVFEAAASIDAISYGEGEIAIAGFVNAEDEARYLESSQSLITREKWERGEPYSFEFVKDLDDIPPLDFSLLEFEKYNSHAHAQKEGRVTAVPLMFSRGCPFRCCFCASHSVHGHEVRYNSLERIKSDIKIFAEKYHADTIAVWDDNFFVNKEQAVALLEYFMEMDLAVEFVNGLPVYRMDEDMAECLKMSGIDVVTLAIESGNARVLKDIIHKPLKLEMVPKAIACLHQQGIYVKGLFVIGFPGETMEDIQVTMDFIHNSGLNWVDIFIAQPLPGSELYDVCKAGGYLKQGRIDKGDFWSGNIETEFFAAGQIEEIQLYHTIKKDFVDNWDMRHGNWRRALINFEYVIHAGHKNPFAYYYAAEAAKYLGEEGKAREYYGLYTHIRKNSGEWEGLFQKFEGQSVTFDSLWDEVS